MVLLSADYSQVELRILAHYTGEPTLRESFARGEDVHRRTASEIFGVMPALVTSEQRRAAQKRGIRLDEKGQGSGLGLSIVKDIAEIYGGSFTLGEAEMGGLLVTLDLPLAGAPTSRRVR